MRREAAALRIEGAGARAAAPAARLRPGEMKDIRL
jgi:hypothetical protein